MDTNPVLISELRSLIKNSDDQLQNCIDSYIKKGVFLVEVIIGRNFIRDLNSLVLMLSSLSAQEFSRIHHGAGALY